MPHSFAIDATDKKAFYEASKSERQRSNTGGGDKQRREIKQISLYKTLYTRNNFILGAKLFPPEKLLALNEWPWLLSKLKPFPLGPGIVSSHLLSLFSRPTDRQNRRRCRLYLCTTSKNVRYPFDTTPASILGHESDRLNNNAELTSYI